MDLNKTINVLKQGGSIVYSTDTVYGLGVDATNLSAVEKMYRIKERQDQPTHVVVSDLKMAEKYVVFSGLAKKLFDKFFPGPITLILPMKDNVSKSFALLSAGTGTLGIRIPKDGVATELVEKLGNPITTPSANPKGGVAPPSTEESKKQFSNKKHKPDFYLDAGELKKNNPSTMVKIIGDKIEVLREGPVSKQELLSIK